ncbi:hypothetical protein OTK49_00170 [Vibrio coralliirubri]|uniref:hypothetical protein n=1 Tax=Vibrio coralliirubri TaxID=1516159 RepID=UPI0022850430|nr:hypothetical protein [Vibrio coralliirubri]MCY9860955.1 hypothetical protein [Vibrio coralliirubri]
MNKEFEKALNYALKMDSLDEMTKLFTSPSGFYIDNGKGGFAKIQSRLSVVVNDIADLVSKPQVEYQLTEEEFNRVRHVASGMGCAINKGGRLAVIKDHNDAAEERGYQIHEVKTPNNRDISKVLHACVVHHRKQQQDLNQGATPAKPRMR